MALLGPLCLKRFGPTVILVLGQRLRRWPNTNTTLGCLSSQCSINRVHTPIFCDTILALRVQNVTVDNLLTKDVIQWLQMTTTVCLGHAPVKQLGGRI